jgi:hypothetical protein
MSESLSIQLVEHQPILRERLLDGLKDRGMTAEVAATPGGGLWLVNVDDDSEAAGVLFAELGACPDARIVITSVRADKLDAAAALGNVVGQIRRPFTLDQLRAYLNEVTSAGIDSPSSIAPAAGSHLDTMLDLAAAATDGHDPDETIELDRVSNDTPVPAAPPKPPVVAAPAGSNVALTVRVYAEAASELMPSWAALEPDERVRVMEEFFLRLAREFQG